MIIYVYIYFLFQRRVSDISELSADSIGIDGVIVKNHFDAINARADISTSNDNQHIGFNSTSPLASPTIMNSNIINNAGYDNSKNNEYTPSASSNITPITADNDVITRNDAAIITTTTTTGTINEGNNINKIS